MCTTLGASPRVFSLSMCALALKDDKQSPCKKRRSCCRQELMNALSTNFSPDLSPTLSKQALVSYLADVLIDFTYCTTKRWVVLMLHRETDSPTFRK